MSQFYASISGSAKNDATRQGTERSGISGHVRGWNVGVKVVGFVNQDGKDEFHIYRTSGSNGYMPSELIAVVTENDTIVMAQDDEEDES